MKVNYSLKIDIENGEKRFHSGESEIVFDYNKWVLKGEFGDIEGKNSLEAVLNYLKFVLCGDDICHKYKDSLDLYEEWKSKVKSDKLSDFISWLRKKNSLEFPRFDKKDFDKLEEMRDFIKDANAESKRIRQKYGLKSKKDKKK